MKHYWIGVMIAGAAMTCSLAAQTSASGSASSNTSVSAGQNNANANTNTNAQVSGGSASANTSGQADAEKKGGKHEGGNSSVGAGAGSATNAAASSGGASLANGTTLQAELTKSLDAKKAKPGDEITAKATQDVKANGQVVVRKGSKLVGHVTEAQARTKENSESRLGVVFDHAILKDGSEVNFNAVVQALAAAPVSAVAMGSDDMNMGGGAGHPQPMGGGSMGGGVVGGATSGIGSTVGGVTNTAGSVASSTTGTVNSTVNGTAGAAVNGTLNSTSRGVVGLQGLSLSSVASSTTNAQTSVISSTTQNVKLDSGTQMVLQVSGAR